MRKYKYRFRRSATRTEFRTARNDWIVTRKSDGSTVAQVDGRLVNTNVSEEVCNFTGGKGMWSNRDTPYGPLRWRAPSGMYRRNIVMLPSYGVATWNGESTSNRAFGRVSGDSYENAMVGSLSSAINLHLASTSTVRGTTNLLNLANTRALLNAKDQKVDMSTAAAELRSTVSMLASTAMQMFRMYSAVRKGNWNGVLREIKPSARISRKPPKGWSGRDAAGRWLELQYGWTPLVADIQGIAEWINTSPAAQLTFKVRGAASEPFTTDLINDAPTATRPRYAYAIGNRATRTVLHYQMEDFREHRNAQGGLINPLVVGWELVPYSLVVDWFIGIGDWLATFDATKGLTFISGTQTEYLQCTIGGAMSLVASTTGTVPPKVYTTAYEVPLNGHCLACRRIALTSWPRPLPVIKNPLSTSHVLNAIALTRQLVRAR